MATKKTKTEEKRYVVLCKGEAWVVGNKQDVINDFDQSPELYMDEAKDIEIYELHEPVPFKFVTPQIVF